MAFRVQNSLEKFKEANDANEIIGRFGLGLLRFYGSGESGNTNPELPGWRRTRPLDLRRQYGVWNHRRKQNRKRNGCNTLYQWRFGWVLEEHRIQSILDKYAKFLPVPVQFGTKTESVEDGEDSEGKPKYKNVEVDNIINNTSPIWTKAPSDLKDEDYLSFYQELYPYSDEPLFWIHLNVDYPFNLTGVLYFPSWRMILKCKRIRSNSTAARYLLRTK